MPLFFQNLRQSKYVRELYDTTTTAETLRFIETYFRVENELENAHFDTKGKRNRKSY